MVGAGPPHGPPPNNARWADRAASLPRIVAALGQCGRTFLRSNFGFVFWRSYCDPASPFEAGRGRRGWLPFACLPAVPRTRGGRVGGSGCGWAAWRHPALCMALCGEFFHEGLLPLPCSSGGRCRCCIPNAAFSFRSWRVAESPAPDIRFPFGPHLCSRSCDFPSRYLPPMPQRPAKHMRCMTSPSYIRPNFGEASLGNLAGAFCFCSSGAAAKAKHR